MVSHKENKFVCEMRTSHKNEKFNTASVDRQATHRASQLIAVCVPAFAKIQSNKAFTKYMLDNKLDITDANEIFIGLAKFADVKIEEMDLNRNENALFEILAQSEQVEKVAIVPQVESVAQVPEMALADTTPVVPLVDGVIDYINTQKETQNQFEIEQALKSCGNTPEQIKAHMFACGFTK